MSCQKQSTATSANGATVKTTASMNLTPYQRGQLAHLSCILQFSKSSQMVQNVLIGETADRYDAVNSEDTEFDQAQATIDTYTQQIYEEDLKNREYRRPALKDPKTLAETANSGKRTSGSHHDGKVEESIARKKKVASVSGRTDVRKKKVRDHKMRTEEKLQQPMGGQLEKPVDTIILNKNIAKTTGMMREARQTFEQARENYKQLKNHYDSLLNSLSLYERNSNSGDYRRSITVRDEINALLPILHQSEVEKEAAEERNFAMNLRAIEASEAKDKWIKHHRREGNIKRKFYHMEEPEKSIR